VFKSVVTPSNTTFNTACTVKINRLSELTIGVVNTSSKPTPKTRMAAPKVANTSTMMSPRRAATAMAPTWRFSVGDVDVVVMVVGSPPVTGGRALISPAVDVIAAVILEICSPTRGAAAVFSRMEDEGERFARVASARLVVRAVLWKEWEGGRTD
jgi:hypothetical protein